MSAESNRCSAQANVQTSCVFVTCDEAACPVNTMGRLRLGKHDSSVSNLVLKHSAILELADTCERLKDYSSNIDPKRIPAGLRSAQYAAATDVSMPSMLQ